ncbi:unnamed protein product [Diabrotica balteata]|uniref:Uncharacterized protein n=1 Tax=Diabrotica balteata TaxID=107213 RepID=A0A9N9SYZ2_DIABA|nr:unnamed protein product [Diabrotica balteata]
MSKRTYEFAVVKGNIDSMFKDTSSSFVVCLNHRDHDNLLSQFNLRQIKPYYADSNQNQIHLKEYPLEVVAALGKLGYRLMSTIQDENQFFVWTMQKEV